MVPRTEKSSQILESTVGVCYGKLPFLWAKVFLAVVSAYRTQPSFGSQGLRWFCFPTTALQIFKDSPYASWLIAAGLFIQLVSLVFHAFISPHDLLFFLAVSALVWMKTKWDTVIGIPPGDVVNFLQQISITLGSANSWWTYSLQLVLSMDAIRHFFLFALIGGRLDSHSIHVVGFGTYD